MKGHSRISGRPNTRSFGTPSFGVSTGNQTFPLSDGATLYLTTVALADRNGVTYNGRIEPDEVIDDTQSTGSMRSYGYVELSNQLTVKQSRY